MGATPEAMRGSCIEQATRQGVALAMQMIVLYFKPSDRVNDEAGDQAVERIVGEG